MATDPSRLEVYKRGVEQEWRDSRVTAAYRKWDKQETEWGRAARDLLINRAGIQTGMKVLDVGSAHGEPGLAIAEVVGPSGHVTLLDIAPDLLAHAAERARGAGLYHVSVQAADAHGLPFDDGLFDRVTSRLAAMYFADYLQAFREARRVLKPGGKAVYLVWGAFEQPMFAEIIGVLFKYVSPPSEDPDAPSPFRFSQPGTLSGALAQAGFAATEESTVTVPTTFLGDPEQWWEWLCDMAPPVQAWLAELDVAARRQALEEVLAALGRYHDGSHVNMPIEVIVASGQKP
jgi:ubiquinone/menaquinone biosynthesis C-methylase UbiE